MNSLNNPNGLKKKDTEYVVCFKSEDFPKFHTGKIDSIIFPLSREEAHEKNIPHIICRIFAFDEQFRFLIQRRSKSRRSHPGLYTDSASGHIQFHKPFNYEYIEQEAWRELEEEMGTHVLYGRLLDLNLEEFRSGGCELAYNFIALIEPYCTPDPIETEPESGFRTEFELKKMLESEHFVPIAAQYWQHILTQNLGKELMSEYHRNCPINKELSHYGLSVIQSTRDIDGEIESKQQDSLNKGKIGAIIGRFQPFHQGHLLLIQHILKSMDFVKIGIGSSQYSHTFDNPFTYEERKNMIMKALFEINVAPNRFIIYPIPDLHNMEKWSNEVLRIFDQFDVFYSNNEWTRDLMQRKGKKIGEITKFEFNFYNGTVIRELIASNSDLTNRIPPSVIEYLHEIHGFERIKSLFQQKKT